MLEDRLADILRPHARALACVHEVLPLSARLLLHAHDQDAGGVLPDNCQLNVGVGICETSLQPAEEVAGGGRDLVAEQDAGKKVLGRVQELAAAPSDADWVDVEQRLR